MSSRVKIVTKTELEKMHAGALTARRHRLLECEESFEDSDRYGYEPAPDTSVTGLIEFKDSDVWKEAYREMKEVLETREHWPGGEERKQKRLEKAKRNKTKERRSR